ncbi:MAG TPA: ATP-binding protein [Pyrinomonadaceae bacterium]|jgi:two-component system sensor histidine kinase KdpD|nr:ATP-binding protein [Pyrinomonadaceae bacterium]
MRSTSPVKSRWFGFGVSILAVVVTTAALKLPGPHINPTTVALAFLLVILFVARAWGSVPAVGASVVGILSLNFFFLPPFGTFAIRDPANWIAFVAFMVTAITVGQLSGNAKQRAEDAENAKREVERLYSELHDSFERSSRAKALKQSERLKSALLDAVTHDFRTPLTSIKASATAMLDDIYAIERDNTDQLLDLDARKEMLQVIDEEADRLDRFVEGLTKLARIDAGDMRLHLQPAAVEEMAATALKRAEPRTRSHRLEVWIEDLPLVTVDEHAISEAIYTLIDNAAKYSPPESPITVRATQKDDHVIVISVEDCGPGIRAEVRDRVFEKFFRAMRDGDVSDRRVSGSGMGLAIAHGIIAAHHGRIWVEDGEGGKGARFVIELPINASSSEGKGLK